MNVRHGALDSRRSSARRRAAHSEEVEPRRARTIALVAGLGSSATATGVLLASGHLNVAIVIAISGITVAIRYWKAARFLDQELDRDVVAAFSDPETESIVQDYEAQIRRRGRRQITQGSLSMSSTGKEGDLSIADE